MVQLRVRMSQAAKRSFLLLARRQGQSAGAVVRGLIDGYIELHEASARIDRLWRRVGRGLARRRATVRTIAAAVRAVRRPRGHSVTPSLRRTSRER